MKLPKLGELMTVKNPETGSETVGKVTSINKNRIKVTFGNNSWVIIELDLPN